MPPEMTYPTTRPHWLAETVAQARRPGQRSKTAKRPPPKRPGSTPAKPPPPKSPLSTPAVPLGSLASRAPNTPPTGPFTFAIMRTVCSYHAIPLALGLIVLDNECAPLLGPSTPIGTPVGDLARCFGHADGLMQTNSAARNDMIPRIPLPLKLQLLELPANDRTDPVKLNQRLHDEFPKRVAVQIAVGVQKLVIGLKAFNGYAALALIAYHAGLDNAYRIATSGLVKAKQGPRFPAGTTEADWEKACHFGASLLHQPVSAVKIKKGSWLCDAKNSTWKAKADFPVWDPTDKVHLIAYQYLRRIPGCIHSSPPSAACNAKTKPPRQPGTGADTCSNTRAGALDKLYQSVWLRAELLEAECILCLERLPKDDVRPLKVEAGRFVYRDL
jgi:hypothetical protein